MAQQEYEAALASGAYSPEEAAKTTRTLFRLAAQNQQYAKAIDFGKQVSDSGAATGDDLGVMAQLYYLQKDCKDSAVWADKAIAAARKAGEAPKENLYQFKLQCASDAGDTASMDSILMDLIRLTNKTTYWNTLLRIERQDERDDHNTLMIYRIMYNTNSMNADTDYIEMAQLLGDAALPGEAAAVLDKAMSTGVIKDEHGAHRPVADGAGRARTRIRKVCRSRRPRPTRAQRASFSHRWVRCITGSASTRKPPIPSLRACKRARSSTWTRRMSILPWRTCSSRTRPTPRSLWRNSRTCRTSARRAC